MNNKNNNKNSDFVENGVNIGDFLAHAKQSLDKFLAKPPVRGSSRGRYEAMLANPRRCNVLPVHISDVAHAELLTGPTGAKKTKRCEKLQAVMGDRKLAEQLLSEGHGYAGCCEDSH